MGAFLGVSSITLVSIVLLTVIFFVPNENNLPMNFRIVFLDLTNDDTEWWLNYLYQIFFCTVATIHMSFAFPIPLLLMNHSSWEIEQTLILVKALKPNKESQDCSERIKVVTQRTYVALRWLEDSQDMLHRTFSMDFAILSLILCMNFFTILTQPPGTFAILAMIFIQLSQFFFICWLGTRVINRVDDLVAAIYDVKWYEMTISDRKSLQLILVMAQNVKGYSGAFNDVNMESFQKVRQLNNMLKPLECLFRRFWSSPTLSSPSSSL